MNAPAGRVMRLALLAYPPSFRAGYGDEMLRSVRDMRRHGGMSRARVGMRVAVDVLLTAPRMRMETLMTRTIAVAVTIVAVLLVSLLVSPAGLAVVPALVVLAVLVGRHDPPIAPDDPAPARWRVHVVRGLAALAVAGAVLVVNGGGELSEPLWAIWALSFVTGLSLVVVGLVSLLSQRAGRRVA